MHYIYSPPFSFLLQILTINFYTADYSLLKNPHAEKYSI